MAIKKVTIHVARPLGRKKGKIVKVTPRCQELCRANGDQIKWGITPKGLAFKVTFKQFTPFGKGKFSSRANVSGPIRIRPAPTGADQFFPYLIEVPGCDPIDPGIIVW